MSATTSRSKRTIEILALVLPGVVLLGAGLIWPFATMIHMSLLDKYPGETALTLTHYLQFVTDSYFIGIALRTFGLALVVTLLTAIIGYPVAWFLARSQSRFKHLVFLGVVSPLLVSIVVRTIGWTILLGNEGLVNAALLALGIIDEPVRLMQSFWSVVVGMVHVLLPFMVLSIASVLGKIDGSLMEAAAVLGANPRRTFTRVVLPLSVQGIAAGSVIVFCLCIGAYITPIWLGRGHVTVMSISIYEQMVVMVEWPLGAAASMILTFATLLILLAYGFAIRRHAKR
ncbi:ABC transporter permease [Rhodoligotrophos ferricapiens]|uniref:ABC transporter permease n=1 Tax=Rhodoligotrophos ferricapiens TaxID=3069264 RepID=UPI00315C5CE2